MHPPQGLGGANGILVFWILGGGWNYSHFRGRWSYLGEQIFLGGGWRIVTFTTIKKCMNILYKQKIINLGIHCIDLYTFFSSINNTPFNTSRIMLFTVLPLYCHSTYTLSHGSSIFLLLVQHKVKP